MACHQCPGAGEGQELSRPDREALGDPLGSTRSLSQAAPGPEVTCGDPREGEGYYPRPQPGRGRVLLLDMEFILAFRAQTL